jgi:hypothetical protein
MREPFEIPEAYQAAFRRLRRRMSADMQADPEMMETALLYLKLGGEKLALHRLGLYRQTFETECQIYRRRLVEDVSEEDDDGDDNEDEDADTDSEDDD